MRHDAYCASERGENAGSAALKQPRGNSEDDTRSRYEDDDQRSNQKLDRNHLNNSADVTLFSVRPNEIS